MEQSLDQNKLVRLREPSEVMRLHRLGSFHQTRLSFMRQLLRRISRENWTFTYKRWDVSVVGHGTVVYEVQTPDRVYSLVAFCHDLPDRERSDRVIAKAWDLTFTLFDGVPSINDIARLKANVSLQEAGRYTDNEIVLGRANKSTRLWEYVVSSLASGKQPDIEEIREVGYLMRTTAVYGSGKFGLADRLFWKDRKELSGPFQAEMLAVYMVRSIVMDLVEHVAASRGGAQSTSLDLHVKKSFGIGNSTGLGMAPFLVNHPKLLDKWILSRETAIATVRGVEIAEERKQKLFLDLVKRSKVNALYWKSSDEEMTKKLAGLRLDFCQIEAYVLESGLESSYPWDKIFNWGRKVLTTDGQEALFSLIIEPYSELVDHLSDFMSAEEEFFTRIDGSLFCKDLEKLIIKNFKWALKIDYEKKAEQARFWYVSEEKLEPRLGERFEEEGANLEQPLAVGRDVKLLLDELRKFKPGSILSEFLITNPDLRHIVKRVLNYSYTPYGEIQDNLISACMKPIDLLRCKLSFFGANRFDPRSDRWLRICMYQNAPFPVLTLREYDDFWPFPKVND